MDKLTQKWKEFTIVGHDKGSSAIHSRGEKYSRENGMKGRMIQREFNQEMEELKETVSKMLELLQGRVEE